MAGSNFKHLKSQRHFWVGGLPGGDTGLKRVFQIQFLKKHGLRPHHYLLDVGCGTLRGGIPIIKYLDRDRYYGIEARDFVLKEGRLELKESKLEHKNPTLSVSDKFQVPGDQQFDFIWAFSVLMHLTNEKLRRCFASLGSRLHSKGVFYANTTETGRDKTWQGYPIKGHSLERCINIGEQFNLKVKSIGTLEKLGHVSGHELQDNQLMLKITRK